MSGGFFNYNQYRIQDIIDSIERKLANQGKDLPKDALWNSADYYKEYPEELKYPVYSDKIQAELRNGINILRIALIYVHCIDWYLSGDYSEETFFNTLRKDLDEIQNN